jgi:Chlorophyll A-B binding protein
MVVQEQFTFGGSYFPKMLPIAAHNHYIETGGMLQILMAIIIFEAISCYALKETVDGLREPGSFGFDPLGLGKDPAQYKKYQANEIMNGRLAMIGVGGMITQMQVYHQGPIEQLLNFKPYGM